nr:retrovirus-related Pol polyprotein from transposon TNT 1-94 [Tanacetum cinerariifolium]
MDTKDIILAKKEGEKTYDKPIYGEMDLGYKLDLSNSGLEEFQLLEFEGYGPKTSNSVSEDILIRSSIDALLVKELVTDDKLEKKTIFPTITKIKFVRPKQQEKPFRKPVKHMTRNMSYLFEHEEIDGGYVSFRGDLKGGKITGKDTECVVLSLDFKLLDESQVLLRVPRKNNMYCVDLKNVAYSEDPLGKFDGKADDGYFVGYSVNSNAFRVFNSRTRIVEKTMHITFLENKPNVVGSGPTWLFDIDTMTKSMNYKPVVVGNESHGS